MTAAKPPSLPGHRSQEAADLLNARGSFQMGQDRKTAYHKSVVRPLLVGLVVAAALLVLPLASAKDFHPGDLRVCNKTRCVAIMNRAVLPQLDGFYSGRSLARVRRPKLGAPYYELRFRNNYVTGIVATRRLGRFLSYGVNLDRFARNNWYAVPRQLSREFRRRTVDLRPLHVSPAA